ncbi:aldose 1-epimerase family protein [Cohnella silvisoli]|uniref:Aldose 1-epimerase family protein n=1 Tax=Cohnella silvisoli TaxID=2873699 RepID=A0ABV1KMD8_9BACL|nr:aldose 1-epimerase family protein [Cohnella silvisoli]MCD9020420.1 aldose 1-epimerase family protein [Cohnella silvisoli]
MKLYGKEWKRRDLEARVGRIEQLGGIERYTMNEGPESGVEMIRIRTGAGLSYSVSPTKGMDISLAEWQGVPLSWSSGNGDPHAAYYDAEGLNWLRTASGGLLMTCGLTQAGSPCEDGGTAHGLHGRIHHTPARHVSATAEWVGDEYEMRVSGVVEETSIFGEHLRLTRTLTSRLGDNRLTIRDTVENAGFQPCPHMMLYHFNFGFPLLAEDTQVELPDAISNPSDSSMDMSRIREWQSPDPLFKEQVFYHQLKRQKDRAYARIHSPSFPTAAPDQAAKGLTVELGWNAETLPRLVQWRMPGAGVHVLGLEPSNCWTKGRAEERKNGTLRIMEPGEAIHYELELICKPQ